MIGITIPTNKGFVKPVSQRRVVQNVAFSRSQLILRAAETQASTSGADQADWVPVLSASDLPKGLRKEIMVDGRRVLLFWYRNKLYAIQGKSPAEGGYSEGFINAKFTQDYGIECPTTSSIYSLKDGNVVDWYPKNPVLRTIQPVTGPMEIYPVKTSDDDLIMVDMSKAMKVSAPERKQPMSKGGDEPLYIQPEMIVVEETRDASGKRVLNPANIVQILLAAVFLGGVSAIGIGAGTVFNDDFLKFGTPIGALVWLATYLLIFFKPDAQAAEQVAKQQEEPVAPSPMGDVSAYSFTTLPAEGEKKDSAAVGSEKKTE